jgi:hypothetical protein
MPNHTAENKTCYGFNKKIGNTNYKVEVHFSQKSKENFQDKVFRMLKNEVVNIA